MCQEKDEVKSQAATRNSTENIKITEKQQRGNRKGGNCIAISKDKQVIPHTRRPGHPDERETRREIESLPMATQNDAIRTNYIVAKIYKTYPNSKFWSCGDREETINHIMTESSKQAKQSIRQDTTGWRKWSTGNSARNWNFIMRPKWYMNRPDISLENKTHKTFFYL